MSTQIKQRAKPQIKHSQIKSKTEYGFVIAYQPSKTSSLGENNN